MKKFIITFIFLFTINYLQAQICLDNQNIITQKNAKINNNNVQFIICKNKNDDAHFLVINDLKTKKQTNQIKLGNLTFCTNKELQDNECYGNTLQIKEIKNLTSFTFPITQIIIDLHENHPLGCKKGEVLYFYQNKFLLDIPTFDNRCGDLGGMKTYSKIILPDNNAMPKDFIIVYEEGYKELTYTGIKDESFAKIKNVYKLTKESAKKIDIKDFPLCFDEDSCK